MADSKELDAAIIASATTAIRNIMMSCEGALL